MTDSNSEGKDTTPVEEQKDPDELLRGLSSENCESYEQANGGAIQEQENPQSSSIDDGSFVGIICSVSSAIRMHKGCVKVRGMICGIGELEKMLTKEFFECGNCGVINELESYSRARFQYENDKSNSTRGRKCISCNNKSGHKYDDEVKN